MQAQSKRKEGRFLDEASRRELAVWLECDPRTLEKALAGRPIRGPVGHRIRDMLAAAGITAPAEKSE